MVVAASFPLKRSTTLRLFNGRGKSAMPRVTTSAIIAGRGRAFPKTQVRNESLQQNERRQQALMPQSVCRQRKKHSADQRDRLSVQDLLQSGESAHRRQHGGKLHVHPALILQFVRKGKSVPA